MKKTITGLFIPLFLPFYSIAQIGIGTENPQKLFHVDGAKDNSLIGTPNTLQQRNDVVITAEGRIGIGTISPEGALDIQSTNSGLVLPRLTNFERDNIPLGYRPTGTFIYNTTSDLLQINIGTNETPIWSSLDTHSSTINTSVLFTKSSSQTINARINTPIIFDTTVYNSTPFGFVTKKNNNQTITLTGGKTYRLEVNMGKSLSSDSGYTWCYISNTTTNNEVLANLYIIPVQSTLNWNTTNSMLAFISPATDTDIQIICRKMENGNIRINDGISPTVSIEIMN